MSDKSGVSSQIISTPKGGGAIQGIGEKFSPDLHTGTGNFTIPITLPPGRSGFNPELSLTYSTGNGNSEFGLGWNLSIPGVSRKTSDGVPRYDNSKDTFILSGAEDLVPVSDAENGNTQYRPRTEGLFALILYHRDGKNDYWEVRSKDGTKSIYGTPGTAGKDRAVVADPGDRSRVFAWKLTQTIDTYGNRIDYLYERDANQEDGPHQWDQLYLSEIHYVDYGDQDNPQFLVKVTFSYEQRSDPFSYYRAGFEIRTVRRCNKITVSTHADAERKVRTYHLVYLDQRDVEPGKLPLNGVSLLSHIQVEGHNSDASEWLPPLEFDYSRFDVEKRDFFPVTGPDLPADSLAKPHLETADLFGNGLPDILEMSGTGYIRYWRNLGNGRFDRPQEMEMAPAGLRLEDDGVQLIDANGDSRIDLMVSTGQMAGYYPLKFAGLWDRLSFQRYNQAPGFSLEDPEVKLVDLDGDGVTDAIRSGSCLECFFNDAKEGWKETRRVQRRALKDFPDINFSDSHVKWADMTGDGLQDICIVYDGNVEYWPSLGWGDWGRRISMRNNPRFPYGWDPKRVLMGDVDGDGMADLVYVDDNKITLWINQAGNRWSDPIVIQGTPPVSDTDAVRLVDLLGSGIAGVLWSSDVNGTARHHMFFLDFTGGKKPYLLTQMDNNMGAVTVVGYEPSTRFYLEDEQHPETRWKTYLPFPVRVVSRVEVIDRVSKGKLTTEYSYHHGYWDGAEREFRGFGRVDQRDTEIFEEFHTPGLHPADREFEAVSNRVFSPPTEKRSWFHQGPVGEEFGDWEETDFSNEFWKSDQQVFSRPQAMKDFLKQLPRRAKRDALRTLRGQVIRTELYALDDTVRQDRPYTVTEALAGVMPLPAGDSLPKEPEPWQLKVFFPYILAERTTQWERGSDPMTQVTFNEEYDPYGQLRSQISIAVPRHRDFTVPADKSEPYLATLTVTDYAYRDDEQLYIVDRTSRQTVYEIVNDGSLNLPDFRAAVLNGTSTQRVIQQTLNFYDGAAFQGLPCGQVGDYGALVRTETLVLTKEILQEAYKSGDDVLSSPEMPPYMVPNKPPTWTNDYPEEFRDTLPLLAGYTYREGGDDSPYAAGFFAITERRCYDFQENPGSTSRGLIKVTRDPLGQDTLIDYDSYDFLPTEVKDAVGLETRAKYDYRVMEPCRVMDPNNNRTFYTFTPLGFLDTSAVMGKEGENVGDTRDKPSTWMVYDFNAFKKQGQPIYVRTIQRVYHVNEADVPLTQRDETIEKVEFSDGFGRLLQTRTQAEDIKFGSEIFGDNILPAQQEDIQGTQADVTGRQHTLDSPVNVTVSGWQIYNNKGKVVEKYEPFFAAGWDYAPPTDEERGQKVVMYYDPRGQVIRTVNPDGSQQRVVYGVPGSIAAPDLSNPGNFEPTPWESFTYDENDNADRTHAETSKSYSHHWNTPASVKMDALGRTVEAVERNGPNPDTDWYTTRSTYDIQGNLLTVTDPLNRLAFCHVYDLASNQLRIENIDAGIRRIVLNAAGNEIERRDSKGALILQAYDILNRPMRLWARDNDPGNVSLRERLEYGDGSDPNQDTGERNANRAQNRLGKLYKHYDEAGLLVYETYDFKGNLLEKVRQVISDKVLESVFPSPDDPSPDWQVQAFKINWQPAQGLELPEHAANLLDAAEYRTSMTYDALDRIKKMQYPQDADEDCKELRPRYNRAGALESVELGDTTYVEHIAYNAKGQRTLIAYGNQVMTRYAYDPQTFKLTRLHSQGFDRIDSLTYRPAGVVLQDFCYEYDLAGNIIALKDCTPGSGIPNTSLGKDVLHREFTYDPLYRLLSATGRESDIPAPAPPWEDVPKPHDVNRTRAYKEEYTYDPVGNMTLLNHQAGTGSPNRDFKLEPGSNRLACLTVGQTDYDYVYDPNGSIVSENTTRHFQWDHGDRMRVFRTQIEGSEPSVHAQYLYDASGQRVKKLVRKQGGKIEVTIYIDNIFEHHYILKGGTTHENNSLHIMDDQARIAMVRLGKPFNNDTTPAVKYHLADHLGSSSVVIDDTAAWINREEYTPYGETSFGSFSKKRYRYTGKERDEESGLYYHGARYYAPWLSRWISVDPKTLQYPTMSPFSYALNNPLRFRDLMGLEAEEPPLHATKGQLTKKESDVHKLGSSDTEKSYVSVRAPKLDWQKIGGSLLGGIIGLLLGGLIFGLIGSLMGLITGLSGIKFGGLMGGMIGALEGSIIGAYVGGKISYTLKIEFNFGAYLHDKLQESSFFNELKNWLNEVSNWLKKKTTPSREHEQESQKKTDKKEAKPDITRKEKLPTDEKKLTLDEKVKLIILNKPEEERTARDRRILKLLDKPEEERTLDERFDITFYPCIDENQALKLPDIDPGFFMRTRRYEDFFKRRY